MYYVSKERDRVISGISIHADTPTCGMDLMGFLPMLYTFKGQVMNEGRLRCRAVAGRQRGGRWLNRRTGWAGEREAG